MTHSHALAKDHAFSFSLLSPRGDVVTALRSTEVVPPKQRSGFSKPFRQHRDSPSPPRCHRSPLRFGQRAAGGDAFSKGGSLRSNVSRSPRRHLTRHRSGRSALSSTFSKGKKNTANENAASARNGLLHEQDSVDAPSVAPRQIDEPDTNAMSHSGHHRVNVQEDAGRLHPSPSRNLKDLRSHSSSGTTTAPTVTTVLSIAGATDGVGLSSNETPTFAPSAPLDSAASHTSSEQKAYPFFLPSFTTNRLMPGVAPPPGYVPPSHRGGDEEGGQQGTAASLSSTPQLASSVPTDIRSRVQASHQQQQQSCPCEGRDRSPVQQFVSQARRPWQSMGEWNLASHVPENTTFSVRAEESGRTNQNGTNYFSGRQPMRSRATLAMERRERRDGGALPLPSGRAPGTLQAHKTDAEDLRNYRFPSIFGEAHRSTSPSQSFALAPGGHQSAFMGGLTHAGPSVMWRSTFDHFARTDEEQHREDVTSGVMAPQPQSQYGLLGAESTVNAMYSFFSPMNALPPAFYESEDTEKAPKEKEEEVAMPAAKATSLTLDAPLSSDDEQEEHQKSAGAPAGYAGLRAEGVAIERSEELPKRKSVPRSSRQSAPLLQGLGVQSSLFVRSGSSFHNLALPASRAEGAFFSMQPKIGEEEDAVHANQLEGSHRLSTQSSDSQLNVGLDRKETMYGRTWLEETGRGGVGEDAKANVIHDEDITDVHPIGQAVSESPYHETHSGDEQEESSYSYSYSDASEEEEDSTSSDSGDEEIEADNVRRPQEQRSTAAEERVANAAVLHRIVSEAEHFRGNIEEEEEYVRAYPTAPTTEARCPRRGQHLNAQPLPPYFQSPYVGRIVNGGPFPYTPEQQQQQQQQCFRRYTTPGHSANASGAMSTSWGYGGVTAPTRAAAYVQAFATSPEFQASPRDVAISSPTSRSSPNGPNVPFRQTEAGPVKVHVLLGFDPVTGIQRVRSPLWSRLPD